MARMQSLKEWAIEEFGENAPGYITLSMYAKNNMISPPARKVGRRWMVDIGSRFVGVGVKPVIKKTDNPKLAAILNDGIENG